MKGYVLAIDQGTTNTKSIALDADARVAASHAVPTPVRYPKPGWVEQSGDEIWSATLGAIQGCVARLPDGAKVATIAVTNQRESVLLWRRSTGETVGPCVTWQCRRSADRLDRLRSPELQESVTAKTGLGLDPLFPAAKIGWLMDEVPAAKTLATKGDLCAGTVDAWLVFRLTGGAEHATDASNASRTQLFDIHTQTWSQDLCAIFGAPSVILPEVRDSNAAFGATRNVVGLPDGTPIRAVMGDSHAALYGHGVRSPGEVKATYGTGSSLMTLTERPLRSNSGLSTTVAWRTSGRTVYALEGNISVSAQAAAWMATLLGLPDVDALSTLAASAAPGREVVFVPALAGLGAPHWKERARAALSGLSLASTRADVARATFEAIALQVRDVFKAMEHDLGAPLTALSADGGATRNEFLMRLQADLLNRPVRRRKILELSAFGVGAMAAAEAGLYEEAVAAAACSAESETITPSMDAARRNATLQHWDAALRCIVAQAR
jgi:glycerol kinase